MPPPPFPNRKFCVLIDWASIMIMEVLLNCSVVRGIKHVVQNVAKQVDETITFADLLDLLGVSFGVEKVSIYITSKVGKARLLRSTWERLQK